MHTIPPPAFRCHRCGELVRVVSRSLNEPGRYSCGHQDRSADLKADQLQVIQLHLDAALVGIVAAANSYTEAITADPGQFTEDLRRALELARRADYPSLILAPDVSGWLRTDWTAIGRELHRQFQDAPGDDPPFLTWAGS